MKLLAFDTSSRYLSLAVSSEGKVLRTRNVILKNKLSDGITQEIEKILKSAQLTLDSIDGFVVGLGPGGFTSLRVGISTLKALAMTQQKPVVGVCSLDAVAFGIKEKYKYLCVLNDARRGLVYSRQYYNINGAFVGQEVCVLKSAQDVLKSLPKETYIVSDAIEIFQEDIAQFTTKKNFRILNKNTYPQARNLISLSKERFLNKKYDDPALITPLYLYTDDCQVRK